VSSILCKIYYYYVFSMAVQPSAGYGLLVSRGFLITQNDPPQSVGLLWTSDSSSQRPLLDNTQQTNVHALGGIRIHDHSRRAAVDLRLRTRGHWDRHARFIQYLYIYKSTLIKCNGFAHYLIV
jgi:hypothetical protein